VPTQRMLHAASRTPLDRASKVPLYLQIKDHVRRLLPDATLRNGRLFTEHDLCRRFGVSRMTVRQAINALVDEGLLYRVRGVGTLCTSAKVTESLERVRDHFEDWEAEGRSVALKILDFRSVEAGSDVARRLGIPERTEVLHVLRLWLVDGAPIGLVYFYIHPKVAPLLSAADVEHSHVRAAVAKRLRQPFLGEQVEIEAGQASHITASHLKIRTGEPVLIRRLTQLYGDGQPLVAANGFYRGTLYRYAVYVPAHTGGERPPRAALRSSLVTMRAIAANIAEPAREAPRGRGRSGVGGAAAPASRE
jgi:GntR family transcriptional regulator